MYGRTSSPAKMSIRRIVAKLLGMVCKVRQRIIDLAHKQILAMIQSSNLLFCRFHAGQMAPYSINLVRLVNMIICITIANMHEETS
jgi:hypothetical protein